MSKPGISSWLVAFALIGTFAFAGCERKERVLDIKTPGADVKVDRNVDTGTVEVKTERK